MSTKMIRTAALALVFAGSGVAHATNYTAVGGSWRNNASWSPSGIPGSGDTVTIPNSVTITVDSNSTAAEQVTVLIVQAGGTLDIDATEILSLAGSNPSATVAGTMLIEGSFQLNASAGTPYMLVQADLTLPAAGGEIQGVVASEIRIDNTLGARTMTNAGTVRGLLKIMAVDVDASDPAHFINNGVVNADAAGTLRLDASLGSITDNLGSSCSSYRWRVSNASGDLRFDKAATGLHGDFSVGPGTLSIYANVTSDGLFYFVPSVSGSVVPSSASFNITGTGGSGSGNHYCANSRCDSASFPFTSTVNCP